MPRSELCALPIAVFPKSVRSGLGFTDVGQMLWGVLSCLVVSFIVSYGPGLSCLVMSCRPSLICLTFPVFYVVFILSSRVLSVLFDTFSSGYKSKLGPAEERKPCKIYDKDKITYRRHTQTQRQKPK